jgi:endonuclease YncB( thermonuclease family)
VPNGTWVYTGTVEQVVDGDTIDFTLSREFDFGFGVILTQTFKARLRLLDVNTQELHRGTDADKAKGFQAKVDTRKWCDAATGPMDVYTTKTDAFCRYLAEVYRPGDPVSLSKYLLDKGYPPYDKR